MAINAFSLTFLILSGIKHAMLLNGILLTPAGMRSKRLSFFGSCLASCVSLFFVTIFIHYNSHSISHGPLIYLSIAGICTVISFVVALFSILYKIGYDVDLPTLSMVALFGKLKILIFPVLAILLIYPVEFYLNPWLYELDGGQETVWEVKKSFELALAFNAGMTIFFIAWQLKEHHVIKPAIAKAAKNVISFWYSLCGFGVLGYEGSIVATRAIQAAKGSYERYIAEAVFILLGMISLYILIYTRKKTII